jgi:hypothetical protein
MLTAIMRRTEKNHSHLYVFHSYMSKRHAREDTVQHNILGMGARLAFSDFFMYVYRLQVLPALHAASEDLA